ncbi:MAG: hypothetical protein K6T31_06225, partial [Alicyclobacillus sp.]|nr:hypothetical protein [Alicyclobacillus sp.]
LGAKMTALQAATETYLADLAEAAWALALAQPALRPLARVLAEHRQRGQARLPADCERLLANMLPDAYHAWEHMYHDLVARMRISVAGLPLSPAHPDGPTPRVHAAAPASVQGLTVAQLRPWLHHPHRLLRAEVWRAWEQAWQQHEDLLARCLNHLGGIRLAVYAARGLPDVLAEPLQLNRCSREVLAAMECAVAEVQPLLHSLVRQRARHLGGAHLDWHDLAIPLVRWEGPQPRPGRELAAWLTEVFSHWNLAWGQRVAQWLAQGWVQVGHADRGGQRPPLREDSQTHGVGPAPLGPVAPLVAAQEAFCVSFPLHRQVRVHVPAVRGWSGVLMLAHELGHACHLVELADLPPLLQSPAVCVMEAVALWVEAWVLAAALAQARTPRQRQCLLDLKARRVLQLLAAARARLQFERAFYSARQRGWVSANQLNDLALAAQRAAFGPGLRQGFPHAWAAQGHAWNTRTPMSDLAYFVGFLLSAALYQRTRQEGTAFASAFTALLRASGQLSVAEWVHQTCQADAADTAFWVSVLRDTLADLTGGSRSAEL